MPVFQSRGPDLKVIGQTILAVVDGMGVFKETALKWLKEEGIEDPKPEEYYSEQSWLNCFKRISKTLGDVTLRNIGRTWPSNVKFPPDINSIEQVLEMMDEIYQMNHIGEGDPGHYSWEKTGERIGIMTTNHPYPCALDHGVLEGFVNHFKEPVQEFSITHLPEVCKMDEGDICKFEIRW